MTIRIYVACLASYNNGVLHGSWIDASSDAEEMREEVNAMLRESKFPNVMVEHEGENVPSAEEYAIHDHEGLPQSFGEYCGLKAVANFMEAVEEAEEKISEEYGADIVRALMDDGYTPDQARDALSDLLGIYENFREYSDEYADACLLSDVDESVTYYFDYEAFACDLKMDTHVIDLPCGDVAIFNV